MFNTATLKKHLPEYNFSTGIFPGLKQPTTKNPINVPENAQTSNRQAATPSSTLNTSHQVFYPETGATLDEDLKQAARDNNDTGIEYLFTLACSQGPMAKEAETFLFDLYTAKESGSPDLAAQLEKDSLYFHEIVQERNAKKEGEGVWTIPEKILLMAGFAANPDSQVRLEITDELNRQVPEMAAYVEINDETSSALPPSIFNLNRMITLGEVIISTQLLDEKSSRFHFLEARPVSTAETSERSVSNRLVNELTDFNRPNSRGNFVPLLFRDHLVLFGISVQDNGEKQSILFDSAHYLNEDEKAFINELAQKSGATNPVFVDKYLQTDLPNCCCLLVTKASECLAENDSDSPSEIVTAFSDEVLTCTPEELVLFNRRSRAEIYGNLLDSIRLYHRQA